MSENTVSMRIGEYKGPLVANDWNQNLEIHDLTRAIGQDCRGTIIISFIDATEIGTYNLCEESL